jgi:pimeloyl-ACP methyl ester carboxylesterase
MSEATGAAAPRLGVDRDRRLAYAEAPRALAEIAALLPAAPYLSLAPRGDGHSVLVLPGLGGGDGSTLVMRRYLAAQGFAAASWDLGRNLGPAMDDLGRRLSERFEAVWRDGGRRRVSLVGWSLGGVYARRLAQWHPDRVRQVITLGSPIGGLPPPEVPGSAVYSRTDGIVPWQVARQAPAATAENIEVYGSHIGLGFNASALYLLAERLAQPEDGWQPFQRSGWKRWVYGADRVGG